MKFHVAIDQFIADKRLYGRINSPATERDYRGTLYAHGSDVSNRDPRYTGRDDVKKTLRRWPHPNSQGKNRAILVSFYDWMVEEGMRPVNPARQTRRARRRPTDVYRMSRAEVLALMTAAAPGRERRAIYLGVCAGLRSAELRGLQGRHVAREGWIMVTADIAKGKRSRMVPVVPELREVVDEIRWTAAHDDYVLPSQRWRDPGINRKTADRRKYPRSAQALLALVVRVGERAGIAARIHPHLMRHAYGEHIARHADMRTAQALLGHAGIATTEHYVGKLTADELSEAVEGFRFDITVERSFYPPQNVPVNPVEAPAGVEPA